jgi:LCP family protein required for cell wall assembly
MIFEDVAEIQIFGESETNLMEELPVLVDQDSIFFEPFQGKNRVNVLLLGINDHLADTIMVASFDYDAKHVDLISIPRDTYYFREGYHSLGSLKINAIYQEEEGMLQTAQVVSEILLGMPLHFYAIIDYEGIEEIVDTIGGVPMNIPFDMKYSDPTDDPPLYINIPEGEQVLDGEHSVQFLRYRKGYIEGDIGRVKAQQEFMKSAFEQMLGFDLPKVTRVIMKNIESDINLSTATKIGAKALGMKGDSIETYVMPNTLQEGAPFYVYPDSKGIAEIITKVYSIESDTATVTPSTDEIEN